jgi:hypothetical protein
MITEDNLAIEEILNPKLTREKYIELRLKGRTKRQICEQYGLKFITNLNHWNLSGWEPDMPIPERKKHTPNKDINKDRVLIENQLPDVSNMVEHPPHYTAGGIECIDAIMAAVTGLTPQEAVCVANVIKYTWRFKHKNGKQDLKKAEWYLKRLTDLQEG